MGIIGTGFSGAETRLRRLFSLTGAVDVEITPKVTAVATLGDGTEPGYNDERGRHWTFAYGPAGAAGPGFSVVMQVQRDVIIDNFCATVDIATALIINVAAPNETMTPTPAPVLITHYRERPLNSTEVGPIYAAYGTGIVGGATAFCTRCSAQGQTFGIPGRPMWMLEAGSKIGFYFTISVSTAVTLVVFGRTF